MTNAPGTEVGSKLALSAEKVKESLYRPIPTWAFLRRHNTLDNSKFTYVGIRHTTLQAYKYNFIYLTI
jgi:hypothetical protein